MGKRREIVHRKCNAQASRHAPLPSPSLPPQSEIEGGRRYRKDQECFPLFGGSTYTAAASLAREGRFFSSLSLEALSPFARTRKKQGTSPSAINHLQMRDSPFLRPSPPPVSPWGVLSLPPSLSPYLMHNRHRCHPFLPRRDAYCLVLSLPPLLCTGFGVCNFRCDLPGGEGEGTGVKACAAAAAAARRWPVSFEWEGCIAFRFRGVGGQGKNERWDQGYFRKSLEKRTQISVKPSCKGT